MPKASAIALAIALFLGLTSIDHAPADSILPYWLIGSVLSILAIEPYRQSILPKTDKKVDWDQYYHRMIWAFIIAGFLIPLAWALFLNLVKTLSSAA